MKYQVLVSVDAEDDIIDIFTYIGHADGTERADHILSGIQASCEKLSELPGRGHVPPELERLGIRDFREIHYKPYRVIYEVVGRRVYIHAILDGRRSLQELLERRLLR